jgi:dTDP-4-dehydrorhamnose reductase
MSPGTYSGSPRRVLILGVTGMLGHTLMRELSQDESFEVHGSARATQALGKVFPKKLLSRVTPIIDATDMGLIAGLLDRVRPSIIVNCIGVIKH